MKSCCQQNLQDQKEAEKFIREVKSKIDRGESVDITKIKKMTLVQIFTEYLKHNTVAPGKRYDLECGSFIQLLSWHSQVNKNFRCLL